MKSGGCGSGFKEKLKCGEKMYSPPVTDELLEFAKDKFKPVKIVKVPVFDFAVHQ